MSFWCSVQISLLFLQTLILRGWMCNWAHQAASTQVNTAPWEHSWALSSCSLLLQLMLSCPVLADICGRWLCFIPFYCFNRSLAKGVGRSESVELNEFPGKRSAATWDPMKSVRSINRKWRMEVWDLHPKAMQLPQVSWGWAKSWLLGSRKDGHWANFWVISSEVGHCSPECPGERTFPHWQRSIRVI